MHCILVYISCDISAIRNQDNDGSLGSIHPMVQAMKTPKKSYSRCISRTYTTNKISRQASFFESEDISAN